MGKETFEIRIDGDPVLREVCSEIDSDYPNLREFVEKMYNTLDGTKNGVGLAAPQVGEAIRLFIFGGVNIGSPERKVFINPEIIEFKGAEKMDLESCLSVPGVSARVKRWQKVIVKYYDLDFKEYTKMFKNFEARIVQHEFDHLEGIEFYDRISKEDLEKIQYKIDALRNKKLK